MTFEAPQHRHICWKYTCMMRIKQMLKQVWSIIFVERAYVFLEIIMNYEDFVDEGEGRMVEWHLRKDWCTVSARFVWLRHKPTCTDNLYTAVYSYAKKQDEPVTQASVEGLSITFGQVLLHVCFKATRFAFVICWDSRAGKQCVFIGFLSARLSLCLICWSKHLCELAPLISPHCVNALARVF